MREPTRVHSALFEALVPLLHPNQLADDEDQFMVVLHGGPLNRPVEIDCPTRENAIITASALAKALPSCKITFRYRVQETFEFVPIPQTPLGLDEYDCEEDPAE